ncbi:MAG: heavy-metal-associated domain-containing protein [Desulfobacterales bacterium]|nr:heavy-metal-associated domain-containing protein [Desulfobacterales bacterium]
MTCAACVRRVENALKEVEGVDGGQRQPGDRTRHSYPCIPLGRASGSGPGRNRTWL